MSDMMTDDDIPSEHPGATSKDIGAPFSDRFHSFASRCLCGRQVLLPTIFFSIL